LSLKRTVFLDIRLVSIHAVTLKPGYLGVTQGLNGIKWYHSIRHPWLPINVP